MGYELHNADCLEWMRTQADNSVDLIATDPPYFGVKGEAWDNQWKDAAKFLEWIEALCVEWQRVLKPNGSLYVFASPQMSARVEVTIAKHFNVLNNIRWTKEAGWHNKTRKEDLRSPLSPWEAVIFAEHHGADNMAKGEAGYAAKCDELRGFVFEPLRTYLDNERIAAGLTPDQVNIACGFREKGGMAGRHWFNASQFAMPTAKSYGAIRAATGHFRREYEDLRREYEDLRREYEDLRREYEDLRRPFAVTADVPYTDVWTFATVQAYKGKHVCEKPAALMEHIIASSSRPGAVVLDCFMGSNATGKSCRKLGRHYIGVERDLYWYGKAVAEGASAIAVSPTKCATQVLQRTVPAKSIPNRAPQLDLFAHQPIRRS